MEMGIRTFVMAALLVTCAFVSVAPGGAPMGFPGAYLGEGHWGFGAEYGYGQVDLETSGTIMEVMPPALAPEELQFRLDNLKSNMIFGTIAYGLTDNWDIFIRLGANDARDDVAVVPLGPTRGVERHGSFDGSFGFAGGAGTRVRFYEAKPWSIGGLVQGTWFRPGNSEFTIIDPQACRQVRCGSGPVPSSSTPK